MCGRFVIKLSPELVSRAFGLAEIPDLPLRYNVAPTQQVPVILHPDEFGLRLDRQVHEARKLQTLFAPYPADRLEAYRVSTSVNSPASDAPASIEPPA